MLSTRTSAVSSKSQEAGSSSPELPIKTLRTCSSLLKARTLFLPPLGCGFDVCKLNTGLVMLLIHIVFKDAYSPELLCLKSQVTHEVSDCMPEDLLDDQAIGVLHSAPGTFQEHLFHLPRSVHHHSQRRLQHRNGSQVHQLSGQQMVQVLHSATTDQVCRTTRYCDAAVIVTAHTVRY